MVKLDRQVARLSGWAAGAGVRVVRVESEVGSGMSGARRKVCRLLAGPAVTTVVAGRRGRLGRVNVELAGAVLRAGVVWSCWTLARWTMIWCVT